MINEPELINHLSSIGFNFHSYITETTEFFEQLSMIHNSKLIISSHGAQLSNLLFASPHASAIELWPVYVGSPSIFCTNFLKRYLWLATDWHDSSSHRANHICDPKIVADAALYLLSNSSLSTSVLNQTVFS